MPSFELGSGGTIYIGERCPMCPTLVRPRANMAVVCTPVPICKSCAEELREMLEERRVHKARRVLDGD